VIYAADDSTDVVSCSTGRDTVYVESTAPTRDELDSCETVIPIEPQPAVDETPPSVIGGTAGDDTRYGTEGNDSVFGSDGNDELFGNGGDDYVDGENDNDVLHGGPGQDQVFGRRGRDVLLGNEGNDAMEGGFEDDVLDGGPGNDTMYGNQGSNRLSGGDGDDRIHTVNGLVDRIDCGPGADIAFVDPIDEAGSSCETVRR
jgi:Ca2+-binding RTX toxin-like protein